MLSPESSKVVNLLKLYTPESYLSNFLSKENSLQKHIVHFLGKTPVNLVAIFPFVARKTHKSYLSRLTFTILLR